MYELYRPTMSGAGERVSRAEEKRDMVALSVQAKDYQFVKSALSKTPDVREDLVQSISKRIQDGTYDVSAYDVAGKIFSQNA